MPADHFPPLPLGFDALSLLGRPIRAQEIENLTVDQLVAGTISAQTITLATSGGVDSIIKSSNYVADTSGWQINSDGSAEFNNVTVRGDIVSSNWDGTEPVDLTSGADSGATAGFALDSSAGAAQFQTIYAEGGTIGALSIVDSITLGTGGVIKTATSGQRVALEEASSDRIRFYSGASNETNPGWLFASGTTDPLFTIGGPQTSSKGAEISFDIGNDEIILSFIGGPGSAEYRFRDADANAPTLFDHDDGIEFNDGLGTTTYVAITPTALDASGVDLLILPTATSDPTQEGEGSMYWDTDDDLLRVYDGSAWTTVGGAAGPTHESNNTGQLATTGGAITGGWGNEDFWESHDDDFVDIWFYYQWNASTSVPNGDFVLTLPNAAHSQYKTSGGGTKGQVVGNAMLRNVGSDQHEMSCILASTTTVEFSYHDTTVSTAWDHNSPFTPGNNDTVSGHIRYRKA